MATETVQGVVLDWCWKIVKRRLQPSSPLFEEGNVYCQLASKYIPQHWKEDVEYKRIEQFPCCVGRCTQVFDSVAKYESHYNSIHRHVCHVCHRILPSSHLLEIHVLESHDTMFTLLADKQDMYQCLVEDCSSKFKDTKSRRHHMIKSHKYPANYRYDKSCLKKSKAKPVKNVKQEEKAEQMDSECKENMEPEKQADGLADTAMEIEQPHVQPVGTPSSGRVFTYKVPKNISFGQGVPRGFMGGRGRGRGRKPNKKHWHNANNSTDMDTAVNIEQVDMTGLAEALDTA